jgi:hypothetical protein
MLAGLVADGCDKNRERVVERGFTPLNKTQILNLL